jgi:hypothetical protein
MEIRQAGLQEQNASVEVALVSTIAMRSIGTRLLILEYALNYRLTRNSFQSRIPETFQFLVKLDQQAATARRQELDSKRSRRPSPADASEFRRFFEQYLRDIFSAPA